MNICFSFYCFLLLAPSPTTLSSLKLVRFTYTNYRALLKNAKTPLLYPANPATLTFSATSFHSLTASLTSSSIIRLSTCSLKKTAIQACTTSKSRLDFRRLARAWTKCSCSLLDGSGERERISRSAVEGERVLRCVMKGVSGC